MRNEVKNILNANRKTFKFLHDNYGFDFEAPFEIIEGREKFTFNKVKKAIEAIGAKLNDDWNIVFLYEVKRWNEYEAEMAIAEMDNEKFYVTREDMGAKNYWNYNMNYAYGRGDFENKRKDGKIVRWWVVAQRAVAKTVTKNIDIAVAKAYANYQRVRIVDKRIAQRAVDDRRTYIYEVTVNARDFGRVTIKIGGGYETRDITDVVDKSGFIVTYVRGEYKRRARALRAEREQNAANTYNCDAENEALTTAITEMRARFTELVTNAKTAEDYYTIDRKTYKVYRAVKEYETYIKKYNNKEYTTIDAIERARKYVIEEIDDVFAKVEA